MSPPLGWNTARPEPISSGNEEKVELGAQLAVVALLGLDQPLEVGGQVLLRRPGRAVDALQHRVALIATPVGAGHSHQLEVPEPTGVGDVRAAARSMNRGGLA